MSRRLTSRLAALLLLAAGWPVVVQAFDGLEEKLATQKTALLAAGETIRASASVRRFYQRRRFDPFWSSKDNASTLTSLQNAIDAASDHGLSPSDYHASVLKSAIGSKKYDDIELLASDAYLTLAAHILGGRLDPVSIEPDWTASGRERDLVEHLEIAIRSGQIAESLQDLEPNAPGYQILKDALSMYRSAASAGGWAFIASGSPMKLGDAGPRVAALRQRLRSTGLLLTATSATDLYDANVETAVAAFQRRAGLEPDGVVGTVTLRELNKQPGDRIDQIKANLERWRWLPENLGERHIRVNIADFSLEARYRGQLVQNHDVIVGRNYRKTPVFSDQVAYMIFNPWWETPPSIARQDKLPMFKKDPASITRQGFQLLNRSGSTVDPASIDWPALSAANFPYRVRQEPGPKNALGRVKIMFPNKHNVYLHDTPSRDLFSKTERAFSSGCVRVANPIGLAEWLLQGDPEWTRKTIDAVIQSGIETRVNLSRKVPVHILYFTAVNEADGTLRLVSDVYARDARLVAALASPPPAAHRPWP